MQSLGPSLIITPPAGDNSNILAQLHHSQPACQLWRTRYYDQLAENHAFKLKYLSEHPQTLLIPDSGSLDNIEDVQPNLGRELITVRDELVATATRLKLTENELDMTRVELIQSQANVLRLENDLSVAQQTVKCQDEGFREAQHKVVKYRMEAQSFYESHQELAERFLQWSIRYDTHGLLLNKLVADLKALGKDG